MAELPGDGLQQEECDQSVCDAAKQANKGCDFPLQKHEEKTVEEEKMHKQCFHKKNKGAQTNGWWMAFPRLVEERLWSNLPEGELEENLCFQVQM